MGNIVKTFDEFVNESLINEGKWSKLMKAANSRQASVPFSLVAIKDGKVVDQIISIQDKDLIPAHYEALKKKHKDAKISLEDGTGKRLLMTEMLSEAKLVNIGFSEEDDYDNFKEFVNDMPRGSIKKDLGWSSRSKSWEVKMDVKVLDSIYGKGKPGWRDGLSSDFASAIIESLK